MEKLMPLDLLSSIKGARSSEAVTELFNVIKKAVPEHKGQRLNLPERDHLVSVKDLRKDEVVGCPEKVKEIIRANFPREQDGFLLVPKVIDD
jgi:Asp-tRNA(Asn)/Glu-tRNA(Gln) amidotransferase C subunit